MSGAIRCRRAYEPDEGSASTRVLVDRIWPRGLTKAEARINLWLKDVAPSTALRKWFGHRPDRWAEFRLRYLTELKDNPAVAQLDALARNGDLTLVFAARDEAHNNAIVLKDYLADRLEAAGDQR